MQIGNEKVYTTDEAAKLLGRNTNTVRVYASLHGLGRVIGGVRFLSDADLRTITKAKPGAPRRKRRAKAPAPAAQPGPAGATQGQGEP